MDHHCSPGKCGANLSMQNTIGVDEFGWAKEDVAELSTPLQIWLQVRRSSLGMATRIRVLNCSSVKSIINQFFS